MHDYTVKCRQAERVQSHGVWAHSVVVEVTQSFTGPTQFAKYEKKKHVTSPVPSAAIQWQSRVPFSLPYILASHFELMVVSEEVAKAAQRSHILNFSQLSHSHNYVYRTVSKPESRHCSILVSLDYRPCSNVASFAQPFFLPHISRWQRECSLLGFKFKLLLLSSSTDHCGVDLSHPVFVCWVIWGDDELC